MLQLLLLLLLTLRVVCVLSAYRQHTHTVVHVRARSTRACLLQKCSPSWAGMAAVSVTDDVNEPNAPMNTNESERSVCISTHLFHPYRPLRPQTQDPQIGLIDGELLQAPHAKKGSESFSENTHCDYNVCTRRQSEKD